MSLPFESGEDVVTALPYDEPTLAQELANWCGGELHLAEDDAAPPVIWVPTARGPRPAALGDWIVRRADGDCYPCDAEKFRALHTPLT